MGFFWITDNRSTAVELFAAAFFDDDVIDRDGPFRSRHRQRRRFLHSASHRVLAAQFGKSENFNIKLISKTSNI